MLYTCLMLVQPNHNRTNIQTSTPVYHVLENSFYFTQMDKISELNDAWSMVLQNIIQRLEHHVTYTTHQVNGQWRDMWLDIFSRTTIEDSSTEQSSLASCIMRTQWLSILGLFLVTTIIGSLNNNQTLSRNKRQLSLFSIVQFPNQQCTSSSSSSTYGTCYTSSECSSKGGGSDGSCAAGFGVCCKILNIDAIAFKKNVTYSFSITNYKHNYKYFDF